MFQTAAGVTVPFPEKLSEQYELDGNTITANLSFEKLSDFVHSFYAELDEPLFLAIHPDAESDEQPCGKIMNFDRTLHHTRSILEIIRKQPITERTEGCKKS